MRFLRYGKLDLGINPPYEFVWYETRLVDTKEVAHNHLNIGGSEKHVESVSSNGREQGYRT